MSVVILDAAKNKREISQAMLGKLEEKAVDCIRFKLEETNILACRSCGACAFKSPGRCVLNDDIHDVMSAVAPGSVIVMITPVRFGGYSSELKKVVDRLMGVCVPAYIVRDGHFLHPMRYGKKTLLGVGIYEDEPGEQTKCFEKLVEHNAVNMQYDFRTLLIKAAAGLPEVSRQLDEILEGVVLR